MRERCLCPCHRIVGERERADGVDVRDEIEAFSVCAVCQRFHCAALSDSQPEYPKPPTPAPFCWTGDDGDPDPC